MRTTLDIADDVLAAAKEIARERKTSIGCVVSDLARDGLTKDVPVETDDGIPQFPIQPNAGIVTQEIIDRLREETLS